MSDAVRAVVDTNVFVSALLKKGSPPAEVVQSIALGELTPLYDARIWVEYKEVFSRPKLKVAPEEAKALLDLIQRTGVAVADARFEVRLVDPKDQPFADVAFTGKADLLITGNTKHFPADSVLRVASPRDWVRIKASRALLQQLGENEGLALTAAAPAAIELKCRQCGDARNVEVLGLPIVAQARQAPWACSECGGEVWLTVSSSQ